VRWRGVLPVVRAVSEIFRGSDVRRQNREKARLKSLFLQRGWTAEKFLTVVEDRLGFTLEHRAPDDPPEDVYRDHVGIHRQRQEGFVYAGVAVLRGRLTPTDMRRAADLAERYGTGELRTTSMQNLPPGAAAGAPRPRDGRRRGERAAAPRVPRRAPPRGELPAVLRPPHRRGAPRAARGRTR